MILITGNTYPVRAQIKALGGTWDSVREGWHVPEAVAPQAQALVVAAPPSTYTPRRRSHRRSGHTRFNSGATIERNPRGRCEDAPCCGCCS